PRPERGNESVFRTEQAVDGAGRGTHIVCYPAHRQGLDAAFGDRSLGRLQERGARALVVVFGPSHRLTTLLQQCYVAVYQNVVRRMPWNQSLCPADPNCAATTMGKASRWCSCTG